MDRNARLGLLLGATHSGLRTLDTGRQKQLPRRPAASAGSANAPGNDGEHVQPRVESQVRVSRRVEEFSDDDDEYMRFSGRGTFTPENGCPRASRSRRSRQAGRSSRRPASVTVAADLEKGVFCPLLTVAKYPYKFAHDGISRKIAVEHFDRDKIWERGWHIYYVYPPTLVSDKPVLLVPLRQVEELFSAINASLSRSDAASIPLDEELGFVLRFEADGSPQPQYIGTCHSKEDKERLVAEIPIPDDPDAIPLGCSDKAWEAHALRLERAYQSARKGKGGRGGKSKPQNQRVKLTGWLDSLRRTQQYLGLRPEKSPAMLAPRPQPSDSWDDYQRLQTEWEQAVGNILPPLDCAHPAPYERAMLPVLVCVDVDSNELQHSQITEVGISVLDTAELTGLAPGSNGSAWMDRIRTRHLRIAERAHIVNSRFMVGCPDSFRFGESELVPLHGIVEAVESCFRFPPIAGEPRKLVFVGHETTSDIAYLHTLGCSNLFAATQSAGAGDSASAGEIRLADLFVDQLDTNQLYRALTRELNGTSLGNALYAVGLDGWHLHNAGNDAHYTMQLLIALTLASRVQRPRQAPARPDPAAKPGKPAPFFPLVCGLPGASGGTASDEAVRLANACAQAWSQEIERRIGGAADAADAARISALCANWTAALSDVIYGGIEHSRGGSSRPRW
ncbi:hypothetical protein KEM52_005315 [Ascosphaera acerosa]|nr:hypothetical protein KEM52_005315 [Ascosphaera acerosa]